MKKINSGLIKLKSIKYIEDSRIRFKDDVDDLMHDIEQRGLLQNVGIRKKDNAIIYGNRRVKAFEKLGYDSIPCDFYEDIDDDDLIIANLSENTKRRDITPIEIGRVIEILIKRNYLKSEVAEKLGISLDRVNGCLVVFQNIKGTKFEDLITYHNNRKGISETLIWSLYANLVKYIYKKNMTKEKWNILLRACEDGKIIQSNVNQLRNILSNNQDMDLNEAIDILDKGKSVNYIGYFKKDVLFELMKKTKNVSEREFVKQIIENKYPELLF